MTLSAHGKRMQKKLQDIVGTNDDIHWEPISASDFTQFPDNTNDMKGDVFVLIGGKESEPLKELEWENAINDPSILDRPKARPPKEIVKLNVTMNTDGNITHGEILKRFTDPDKILACMEHRFDGYELDKCLGE